MRLLLPLIALIGCSSGERTECDEVVARVNSAMRVIAESDAGETNPALVYLDRGERYDALASELDARPVASVKLNAALNEYRAMLLRAADVSRSVGDALQEGDEESLVEARRDSDALLQSERNAVSRLNAACRPK